MKAYLFIRIFQKIRKYLFFLFFLASLLNTNKEASDVVNIGLELKDYSLSSFLVGDFIESDLLSDDKNESETFFLFTQSTPLIKTVFIKFIIKFSPIYHSFNLFHFFTDLPPPLSI